MKQNIINSHIDTFLTFLRNIKLQAPVLVLTVLCEWINFERKEIGKKRNIETMHQNNNILVPAENDVLAAGRGNRAKKHPGNLRYHSWINELRDVYAECGTSRPSGRLSAERSACEQSKR